MSNIVGQDVLTNAVPMGQHVEVTCINHPNLRWSTKNVGPRIGSRSLFFMGSIDTVKRVKEQRLKPMAELLMIMQYSHAVKECSCPLTNLYLVGE
jgi:hypothetical protein